MNENNSNSEKRVVSFFIWDPDLENKIDREVKMIDGISKLLNVATTVEQSIEANKALVLSQQRMLAFMGEIRRKQQNLLKRDDNSPEATKATVILSDIHFPLDWSSMKKVKSDKKKFAVFCLARIGYEIIDTQMKFIDKHSTDILFTDNLIFENVPHHFQLELELYALNKSLALSNDAKDFADRYSYYSLHGSPRFRRKKAENENTNKNTNEQQSKFVLIARAIYTKDSSNKMAIVRNLTIERKQDNPLMQLPIGKTFTSRFVIQPLCHRRSATFAGIAEINRIPFSCTLAAGYLNCEEIVRRQLHDPRKFSIPITPDTIILSRDDRLSFSIYNQGYDQQEFFVQDHFILNVWIRALQQHIIDMRMWGPAHQYLPPTRRNSYQAAPLSTSLTDLKKSSNLTFKARSLDNLHQTNEIPITVTIHRSSPAKNVSWDMDRYNTDNDDDDNDEADASDNLVLSTRL